MTGKNWKQKATFQKIEKFLKTSEHQSQSHKFWREELDKNFSL